MRFLSLLLLAALGLFSACSSTNVDPPDPLATPAASIPLLPDDRVWGTTLYGSADLPPSGTPERDLLHTAAERGLNGFTYYVDWADLEPAPGQYTLTTFTATLDALQQLGVRPFVNLTVGDIEDYNLPDGLSDGNGGLADGVSLDDPAVLDRFGHLLDRVVPLLLDRGGFLLGVGNEIDARLDASSTERDAYVRFVAAARDRVHRINDRLAVGVTLTGHAIRAQSDTFQAMRAAADVVAFNHAPIQPDFFVRDVEDIRADFQDVLSAFGSGPILIQELTCPSASSMGASETWQRRCFEELFGVIVATPQIRFASVFTFQDLDEATCEAVREVIFGDALDDLPEDVATRLADYLCELGIVAPDGTAKPAWPTVLEAVAR